MPKRKYSNIPYKKREALRRLIFLVRTDQIGEEKIGEKLDKLNIPMWKQNYISMLAEETKWGMEKIIEKVYFLKSRFDFNVTEEQKKGY
jgi:hypothetical protein